MSDFLARMHKFFFEKSFSLFEFICIVQLAEFAREYDNYWLVLFMIPVWIVQYNQQQKLEK